MCNPAAFSSAARARALLACQLAASVACEHGARWAPAPKDHIAEGSLCAVEPLYRRGLHARSRGVAEPTASRALPRKSQTELAGGVMGLCLPCWKRAHPRPFPAVLRHARIPFLHVQRPVWPAVTHQSIQRD